MTDDLITKVRARAHAKNTPYGVGAKIAADIALDMWGLVLDNPVVRTELEVFMTSALKKDQNGEHARDFPLAMVTAMIDDVEAALFEASMPGVLETPGVLV